MPISLRPPREPPNTAPLPTPSHSCVAPWVIGRGVKTSDGIRTPEDVATMLGAGVTRTSASAGVSVLADEEAL